MANAVWGLRAHLGLYGLAYGVGHPNAKIAKYLSKLTIIGGLSRCLGRNHRLSLWRDRDPRREGFALGQPTST